MMPIRESVISSQLLIAHERRMTTSVYSLNRSLARYIASGWKHESIPQARSMIYVGLQLWQIALEDLLFRFHYEIMRDGILHVMGLGGRKNDQLEFILNFIRPSLREYSERQARLIEDFLRKRIEAELASGETPMQVRNNIVRVLNTRDRALKIASTEAHTALERGAWEAANALGIRITKRWVSREDAKVRSAHAAANGQVREIDQPFEVGGEGMMYPGDPSSSARNRINCRCTTAYKLGG